MPAPTMQAIESFDTDGNAGDNEVDIDALPDWPVYGFAIACDVPTNGKADRLGAYLDYDPDKLIVDCPPKVGGLPVYTWSRTKHSILQRDAQSGGSYQTVPANDTLVFPHNLGGVPDAWFATLYERPVNEVNWAVIAVDDTNMTLKNWHATEDILVQMGLWRHHSIQNPAESMPMLLTTQIAGLGEVTVPHGLGRTPDVVAVTPYAAGGVVEPSGMPILSSAADDTNIYVANVDAAADMIVAIFAQATHSIQL